MTDPNVPSETPATPATPYVAPAAAGPKQGLSLTSFITGLGAFVFSWIPIVGFLGFVAGIVAVITGFMAKGKEPAAPKWMWIVGLIAGFIGIAISLVYLIGFIMLLSLGSAVTTYGY